MLSVSPLHLEEVMTLDDTTLAALQIFARDFKTSGSKKGSWNREARERKEEGNGRFATLGKVCPLKITLIKLLFSG